MTRIGRRIALGAGSAVLLAALAAPGAQAAPTFRGLDRQGNLLTIERIKKVTRKNNGKKITTRFYAATEKVKVDADKER